MVGVDVVVVGLGKDVAAGCSLLRVLFGRLKVKFVSAHVLVVVLLEDSNGVGEVEEVCGVFV